MLKGQCHRSLVSSCQAEVAKKNRAFFRRACSRASHSLNAPANVVQATVRIDGRLKVLLKSLFLPHKRHFNSQLTTSGYGWPGWKWVQLDWNLCRIFSSLCPCVLYKISKETDFGLLLRWKFTWSEAHNLPWYHPLCSLKSFDGWARNLNINLANLCLKSNKITMTLATSGSSLSPRVLSLTTQRRTLGTRLWSWSCNTWYKCKGKRKPAQENAFALRWFTREFACACFLAFASRVWASDRASCLKPRPGARHCKLKKIILIWKALGRILK